nr:VasL domain-containing protein [uncultured Enterobacter sp.]
MNNPKQLKTGSDPRALADYVALRDEMMKLSHPARPDVDWKQSQTLCLRVFEQNGVELQSGAWYTLARMHIDGLAGMNEGLALINALMAHHWAVMWPVNVHARVEILGGLNQRIQNILRTLALNSRDDLPALYQSEKCLAELNDILARHELKQACRTTVLLHQVSQAIVRLENAPPDAALPAAVTLPPEAVTPVSSEKPRLIYVAQPEPMVDVASAAPPRRPRRIGSFMCGAGTALVICGIALWGWNRLNVPPPADRQQLEKSALPVEAMENWHNGMAKLQQLTDKLNALDEKRGKYLTVSELKSAVFDITRTFSQNPPAEEQLRMLAAMKAARLQSFAAQQLQSELRLKQLNARYLLLTQTGEVMPGITTETK